MDDEMAQRGYLDKSCGAGIRTYICLIPILMHSTILLQTSEGSELEGP